MGQKTFSQYRKLVRENACRRFIKERAILDVAITVFIGLLVGAVVAYLIEKPKSLAEIGWSEPMIAAIVTFVFTVVVYTAIYIFIYLRREPLLIYNNQETVISEFKEKWDGERVPITKVVFLSEQVDDGKAACLRIVNGEDFDLVNCFCTARKVMEKVGRQWKDKTHEANKSSSQLLFPVFPRGGTIIRRDKSSEIVKVGELTAHSKIGFTHHGYTNAVGNGLQNRLYVEIEFSCDIQGNVGTKHIKPLVFTGFLIRKKAKNSETLYLEKGNLQ